MSDFDAGEQLDQGRLAGAVDADQRDAVAALDGEVDFVEDDLGRRSLGDVGEFGDHAAAGLGLREARNG
ncbi:MAG: hypothetical protein QM757_16910 [Paludibaculum sp.]